MSDQLQFTKIAILDELKRLNNSVNGNPRYKIRFDSLGIDANTKSDSSYCYKICSFWENKPVRVTYRFTPKGRIVIDDLEYVERN